MPSSAPLTPCRLADCEERAGTGSDRWIAEHDQVELVSGPVPRIDQRTVADLRHLTPDRRGCCEPQRPLPNQLLEARSEDRAGEPLLGTPPHPATTPLFQHGPRGPHDRVVEADQRFGDLIAAAAPAKQVGLPGQQAGVLQHRERMLEVGRVAPDVGGDAAAGAVALGDGRQHRVVERGLAERRILGKEVSGLAEQRADGVQHGPNNPVVEVVCVGRHVVLDILAAVSGSAAHDGMHLSRQRRIAQPPKPARPRSGADPASSPPMNDSAEPHSRILARDPDCSGRPGVRAC